MDGQNPFEVLGNANGAMVAGAVVDALGDRLLHISDVTANTIGQHESTEVARWAENQARELREIARALKRQAGYLRFLHEEIDLNG